MKLTTLPCLSDPSAPSMVLIHGWGMSSRVWQAWLPTLREHCHIIQVDLPGYGLSDNGHYPQSDQLIADLLAQLPEKAIYFGYSLGGMLATSIAHRFPERVLALVTLASNIQFVANSDWPDAMDQQVYNDFYSLVEKNAVLALKRFAALQAHGATSEKTLVKWIRENNEKISEEVLTDSLNLLSSLNSPIHKEAIIVPALYLFADNDALVPVTAAKRLQSTLGDQVSIIEQSCHSMFLDKPDHCWKVIKPFISQSLTSTQRLLDKQQVARSFSRAADTYDSVAELQRRIGNTLVNYLPSVPADIVLDLGCGTGYFTESLQATYPQSQVIGLDLAQGMVSHASKHHAGHQWLCGDAENLPLTDNSIDIIFSSLAIQWCEDNKALFSEVFRVLKPAGHFVFATLGPNTLHELRRAWQQVDNFVHVNRFVDRDIIDQAISGAGFSSAYQTVEENIVLEYGTLKQLTKELKGLGAHNVNSGRQTGLTGKQRVRGLITAYDQQRNEQGALPATYQTWYGVLEKPIINLSVKQQGLG